MGKVSYEKQLKQCFEKERKLLLHDIEQLRLELEKKQRFSSKLVQDNRKLKVEFRQEVDELHKLVDSQTGHQLSLCKEEIDALQEELKKLDRTQRQQMVKMKKLHRKEVDTLKSTIETLLLDVQKLEKHKQVLVAKNVKLKEHKLEVKQVAESAVMTDQICLTEDANLYTLQDAYEIRVEDLEKNCEKFRMESNEYREKYSINQVAVETMRAQLAAYLAASEKQKENQMNPAEHHVDNNQIMDTVQDFSSEPKANAAETCMNSVQTDISGNVVAEYTLNDIIKAQAASNSLIEQQADIIDTLIQDSKLEKHQYEDKESIPTAMLQNELDHIKQKFHLQLHDTKQELVFTQKQMDIQVNVLKEEKKKLLRRVEQQAITIHELTMTDEDICEEELIQNSILDKSFDYVYPIAEKINSTANANNNAPANSTSDFYSMLLGQSKLDEKQVLRKPGRGKLGTNQSNEQILKKPSERTRLPPLKVSFIQKNSVVLDEDGHAKWAMEQIETLEEPTLPPYSFFINRSCQANDEMPMMPCHSALAKNRLDQMQKWPEPIRNRNKIWIQDELSKIIAIKSKVYKMSRMTKQQTGFGFRWKLNCRIRPSVASRPNYAEFNSMKQIFLSRKCLYVSEFQCVVTVHTAGVTGRIYDEVTHTPRCLVIQVFISGSCIKHTLVISMSDLISLFGAGSEFLKPGHKTQVGDVLPSMLYFEVPRLYGPVDKGNIGKWYYETADYTTKSEVAIIKISNEIQPNMGDYRRALYAAEQKRILDEKRRKIAAIMALPKRSRYRLLCKIKRIFGFVLTITIHQYPKRKRILVVRAYHVPTNKLFELDIGINQAAASCGIMGDAAKITMEETLIIARHVFNIVTLRRTKVDMALSIADRIGQPLEPLLLTSAKTDDTRLMEVVLQDGARQITHLRLEYEEDDKTLKLEKLNCENAFAAYIVDYKSTIESYKKKIAANMRVLSEIDAGKWQPESTKVNDDSDSKLARQQRRQEQKDMKKQMNNQIKEFKSASSQFLVEVESNKLKFRSEISLLEEKIVALKQHFEIRVHEIEQNLVACTTAGNDHAYNLCSCKSKYSIACQHFRMPKLSIRVGVIIGQRILKLCGVYRHCMLSYAFRGNDVRPLASDADIYTISIYTPQSGIETVCSFSKLQLLGWAKREQEDLIYEVPGMMPQHPSSKNMEKQQSSTELTAKRDDLLYQIYECSRQYAEIAFNPKSDKARRGLLQDIDRYRKELTVVKSWPKWMLLLNITAKRLQFSNPQKGSGASLNLCIFMGAVLLPSPYDLSEMIYFRVKVLLLADSLLFQFYNIETNIVYEQVPELSSELLTEFTHLSFLERHIQISILLSALSLEEHKDGKDVTIVFG